MNKLPVEMLFEIFSRTSFKDQRNLRFVNKKYKNIIDSKIFQKNIYHILFKRISKNVIYKNSNNAIRRINKKIWIDNLLDKNINKSKPFWKNIKFQKNDDEIFVSDNIRGLVKKFIIIGKNIKKAELYFENTLVWKCDYLSNNIIKIQPFDFGISSFLSSKIRLLIKSQSIDKIFSHNFVDNYNQNCPHFNFSREFDIFFYNDNKIYTKILFFNGTVNIR